jgi:hypothetical protein
MVWADVTSRLSTPFNDMSADVPFSNIYCFDQQQIRFARGELVRLLVESHSHCLGTLVANRYGIKRILCSGIYAALAICMFK